MERPNSPFKILCIIHFVVRLTVEALRSAAPLVSIKDVLNSSSKAEQVKLFHILQRKENHKQNITMVSSFWFTWCVIDLHILTCYVHIQIPSDWLCGSHIMQCLLQAGVPLRVLWGYSDATVTGATVANVDLVVASTLTVPSMVLQLAAATSVLC